MNPTHEEGSRTLAWLAWLAWAVTFGVVVGLGLSGFMHSISYDIYEAAGLRWMAGSALYETTTVEGFQYFPQAAMLFAPFAAIGSPWGGFLWRAVSWGLLAMGTDRLSRLMVPAQKDRAFAVASCLAIGPAIGALGNGQANLILAALALLAAADVVEQRWWRASLILVLGVAVKPHFAIVLLLVWALYRPMMWRIPLVAIPVFVSPWVFADHAYVAAQYSDWLAKLRVGARPGPEYEDLRGMLSTMGWVMPHAVAMVVRVVAGGATLGICAVACRRTREPFRIALVVAFAAVYLMLFNPRTQSSTYAIPGALVAVLAATHLLARHRREFLILFAVQVAFTLNYHYLPSMQLWLKPLASVALGMFLVVQSLRPPADWVPTRPG
ncbi:MAG: glycosyltransferase family 87 protein [Polyangiales bacterium]